jgi:CxxC motif-containing protein (DUF1111 family)
MARRFFSNESAKALKRRLPFLLSWLLAGIAITAPPAVKARPNHPAAPIPMPTPFLTGFGGLLAGVTADQKAAWIAGLQQFQVVDGPADGLGPIFNNQSCVSCHSQPVAAGAITPGGASAVLETRFGKLTNGRFDPLTSEGGTLLHQMALAPFAQDNIPSDANVVASRKTTPTFGLGLIEAIPDAAIEANAHHPPVDGVTGRAAILTDSVTQLVGGNVVGRFGWKCQESTLLAFSADAELNEMGVTNRFFTTDLAPGGNQATLIQAEPDGMTPTTLQDLPANPALAESPTNKDDIARFTDFLQLNAPPPVVPLTPQAQRGQALFAAVNCVACHKPTMQTGPSTVSVALAFQNVPLYSDLLLHRMGALADGIAQAAAQPDEMRTAPLWGLRARSPFLHDGRASTILQAILMHDGEARVIRDRFANLSEVQQNAIIAFLESI